MASDTPPQHSPVRPAVPNFVSKKPKGAQKAIAQFHRSIHSRSGLDCQLYLIGETSRLITVLLGTLSQSTVNGRSLPKWLRSRMPNRGSKLLTRLQPSLANSVNLAGSRMQILTAMLEEWQILNRLLGLLDTYMALKELICETLQLRQASMQIDGMLIAIRAWSLITMGLYFAGENLAFISSKGLIRCSLKTQERLAYFANRSWATSVLFELSRLLLERRRIQNEIKQTLKKEGNEDEKKNLTQTTEDGRLEWRDEFLSNLAWMPVTAHLSVRGGILPEYIASVLSFCAVLIPARKAWNQVE